MNHEISDHEIGYDQEQPPADSPALSNDPGAVEAERWRQEVASRVQQHRARRRKRLDPDGSMSLDLDFAPELADIPAEPIHREPPPLIVPRREEVMPMTGALEQNTGLEGEKQEMDPPWPAFDASLPPQPDTHKIIRFPRTYAREAQREQSQEPLRAFFQDLSRTPSQQPRPTFLQEPPTASTQHPSRELPLYAPHAQKPPMVMVEVEMPEPPLQELPVQAAPRIVYASEIPPPAEQMELLPSFDDIRLESPVETSTTELELPPQVAPLNARTMSGLVDAGIVVAATGVLTFGFMQVAGDQLSARMAVPCLLATCGVLWLIYQYLFLVHGQGTPGMAFADLELVTFAGEPVSVFARRYRALACALSAFSVGLGYAWALVDEDALGWHDRMTGTCLKTKHSAISTQHSANREEPSEMDLPY